MPSPSVGVVGHQTGTGAVGMRSGRAHKGSPLTSATVSPFYSRSQLPVTVAGIPTAEVEEIIIQVLPWDRKDLERQKMTAKAFKLTTIPKQTS